MKLDKLEGKPIQIRPTRELRKRLEAEAEHQHRSLNNLIVVLLTRMFRSQDGAADAEGKG